VTNAERIRKATDEELADFLFSYVEPCFLCAWRKECDKHPGGCEEGRLAWLRQEWEG
jgi:hypothetical protein